MAVVLAKNFEHNKQPRALKSRVRHVVLGIANPIFTR